MFKLMDKKIITILRKLFLHNWPYENVKFLSEMSEIKFLTGGLSILMHGAISLPDLTS